LRWGSKVKFLHEVWEETGEQPAALQVRPVLNDVWAWPHSVFKELSGSRQVTDGTPALLLFSEVALYGLVHSCSRLELAELWQDVHKIDLIWQTEVAKIQEAQAD